MKNNKKLKSILLCAIAVIGILSTVKVLAGQYLFYMDIPRTQGYAYTKDYWGDGYITGATANKANVYLEGFSGISAVTIYAGAYVNGGSSVTWGNTGAVIYKADFDEGDGDGVVPYSTTYAKNQKMGLRARNHNWSLNTGSVSGTVDYH